MPPKTPSKPLDVEGGSGVLVGVGKTQVHEKIDGVHELSSEGSAAGIDRTPEPALDSVGGAITVVSLPSQPGAYAQGGTGSTQI